MKYIDLQNPNIRAIIGSVVAMLYFILVVWSPILPSAIVFSAIVGYFVYNMSIKSTPTPSPSPPPTPRLTQSSGPRQLPVRQQQGPLQRPLQPSQQPTQQQQLEQRPSRR